MRVCPHKKMPRNNLSKENKSTPCAVLQHIRTGGNPKRRQAPNFLLL